MSVSMTERTCAEFSDRLAAREPVPGGGGASAYVGALGTACCTMACRFIEGRPACAAHDPACSRAELMSSISAASEDPAVHGILVFRPLPASLDVAVACEAIAPEKDVDVGITWDDDAGRLVGDVNFDIVEPVAGAITPLPGGVGSLTTAVLMKHVVQAAERAATRSEGE